MADPFTIVSLATMAVTAVAKGVSAYETSQADNAQAKVFDQESQNALAVGSANSEEQGRKSQYLLSKELAGAAASGGGTGGSSAAVMAASAGRGVYNQNLDMWQANQTASKYAYEGQLEKSKAENALVSGGMDVGSAILSGTTNAAKTPGWQSFWGNPGSTGGFDTQTMGPAPDPKPRGVYFN